jgi:hypothetical protein
MTDRNALVEERAGLQDRIDALRSQAVAANRGRTAEEEDSIRPAETRIAQINVELGGPPDPISITPAVETNTGGNLGRFTVIGGGPQPSMLSITGLPVGAKGVFSPNPTTGRADLTIHLAPARVSGRYEFTVTAISGSVSSSATATLVI